MVCATSKASDQPVHMRSLIRAFASLLNILVKLLTEHHLELLSLNEGCRGLSESTHVKMPHCWMEITCHGLYYISYSKRCSFSCYRIMAAAAAVDNIHNSIRTLSQTKRIRVTEFFQDFDKLRSGFVTGKDFFVIKVYGMIEPYREKTCLQGLQVAVFCQEIFYRRVGKNVLCSQIIVGKVQVIN